MSILTYVVMFGWIPAILYIFSCFSTQRAVIISFIGAWLFLPEAAFPVQGLPDYTKITATCYGILIATAIFDTRRLTTFKLCWLDLPMLVWCICPFASSIANGLGLYDGFSATLSQIVIWGGPYFLGRIYLGSLSGLSKLAVGIFIGGLVYVPLCLYEVRFSPQLHRMFYGFFAHSFAQTIRYGGYRPTVFMKHGLMVGMWMMAATLIGVWLWRTGVIKKLWDIPVRWLVFALMVTFIFVKSTGAYLYVVIGVLMLFTARWYRTAILLLLLILSLSFYLYLAASGNFDGDHIVNIAARITNEDRAGSLEYRIDNEGILSNKARQKPIFGWGGWGRARVYEENWEGDLVDIAITDSLWIISFGNLGSVGLISLTASMILPVASFILLRYPAKMWSHPKVAPAAALAVVIVLYMLDCTLNSQLNPVFTLANGGIAGLVVKGTEKAKKHPNYKLIKRLPTKRRT